MWSQAAIVSINGVNISLPPRNLVLCVQVRSHYDTVLSGL